MVEIESVHPEPIGTTSGQAALPTAVLEAAVSAAQGRLEDLTLEMANLRREVLELEAEEKLLTRLLAVRRGEIHERSGEVDAQGSARRAVRVSKNSAIEEVISVLEEAKRPVHVSDLMRILDNKNVAIPGAGTQANLISHMSRDPRIVRPSRGMYGLKAWGLEDMPKGARKPKKTRRTSTRRARTK